MLPPQTSHGAVPASGNGDGDGGSGSSGETAARGSSLGPIWFGLGGLLIFVIAVASALDTGMTVARGYKLVDGDMPARAALTERLVSRCSDNGALWCVPADPSTAGEVSGDATETDTVTRSVDMRILRESCLPAQKGKDLTPACLDAWQQALWSADRDGSQTSSADGDIARAVWSVVGWAGSVLTFASPSPETLAHSEALSLVPAFVLALTGICVLIGAVGSGMIGTPYGMLVDGQNRLSLGKTQAALWTVVIIGAYAILASFKVGALSFASSSSGDGLFPELEAWAWAALGISVSSTYVSVLVKNATPKAGTVSLQSKGVFSNIALPALARPQSSPQDASIANLFSGENEQTAGRPDLSRIQNILFTIILLLTYTGALVAEFNEITIATYLDAVSGADWLNFPDPGPTFAALLGFSHATYIIGKFSAADTETRPPNQ
ncbi:hypothetical protein [Jiella pelagia]|uniref:Uncharacterized protein n=1 Tax=Jiella pelagia TaxID=2986949 RepID=A0ABY7BWC6_9HYPH|nr:hypothetical protein [Jiella pelagia]WAP67707.1 hypothetical protein OH818_19840 [Jiella pelagia]